MTNTNLFADDPGHPPEVDLSKNYLEELVGDGKKFKSPEELARGKYEADQFISRLQNELAGLRTELSTKQTLEQYIDKMSNSGTNNIPPPNEPNGNQGEPSSLKPEDIERLIAERLEKRDQERTQTQNLQYVKEQLSQSIGPDFSTKLKSIGQAIGMTEDDMTDMARNRPKALLALVTAQASSSAQPQTQGLFTPPTGTNLPSGTTPVDRTQRYYEDLRKKSPTEYWSPSVQNQLHKDAIRLGEKFFDVG